MKKVAIFGGTFDPFTQAHRAIVESVLDKGIADDVIVVPTIVDYYRTNKDDVWFGHGDRLWIITEILGDLITAGKVHISTNEYKAYNSYQGELRTLAVNGRRFAHTLIDVVNEYTRNCLPVGETAQYKVVIGTDQARNFKNWFCWEAILKAAKLVVVTGRDGDKADNLDFEHETVKIDPRYATVSASKLRAVHRKDGVTADGYLSIYRKMRDMACAEGQRELIARTPVFDLVRIGEVKPGFSPVRIEAPDWVVVVVRDKDNHKYLCTVQLRYAKMRRYREFVCGQVDQGEQPIEAAVRELREESGLDVSKERLVLLGRFAANPAILTNTVHIYYVEVDNVDIGNAKKQDLDEHEEIDLEWVEDTMPIVESEGPAYMALAELLADNYKD